MKDIIQEKVSLKKRRRKRSQCLLGKEELF
jgi:hypothetical protein